MPSQTVPLLQTPRVQCITVWFISGEIHAFIIKYSQTSVEVRFPSVSFWVSLVALERLLLCRLVPLWVSLL